MCGIIVLEYAEHGDLFASWCCTPGRQVPLDITRLYSAEIALALGNGVDNVCVSVSECVCVRMYMCVSICVHPCMCVFQCVHLFHFTDFLHSRRIIYRDLKVCE